MEGWLAEAPRGTDCIEQSRVGGEWVSATEKLVLEQ